MQGVSRQDVAAWDMWGRPGLACKARAVRACISLFVRLISHQPAVLFSQNKPATSNQPAVLFSQNKSAPAISHQPNEQAVEALQTPNSMNEWNNNTYAKSSDGN
jgi:hypothetical protein